MSTVHSLFTFQLKKKREGNGEGSEREREIREYAGGSRRAKRWSPVLWLFFTRVKRPKKNTKLEGCEQSMIDNTVVTGLTNWNWYKIIE